MKTAKASPRSGCLASAACRSWSAPPVVAGIGFLRLLLGGMGAARAVGDEGFDVVGKAVDAMSLLEQQVAGRPAGLGSW